MVEKKSLILMMLWLIAFVGSLSMHPLISAALLLGFFFHRIYHIEKSLNR